MYSISVKHFHTMHVWYFNNKKNPFFVDVCYKFDGK